MNRYQMIFRQITSHHYDKTTIAIFKSFMYQLTVFRYSFFVFKLFLPQSFTQIHRRRYQMLFGVGMMLKGAGTVPPSSKYDIHNLLRANFHSTSAFSLSKHIETHNRSDNAYIKHISKHTNWIWNNAFIIFDKYRQYI